MRAWRLAILTLLASLTALLASPPAIAQTPGTLVSAEPVVETPPGAQAWRIRYMTSNDRGIPIEVTGMVIAPREATPPQPRPVLAWGHGTWGVDRECSPRTDAEYFAGIPGLADAISRGYTVVAADYSGLGSPQSHPYLVGTSTAHAVLDAVRAARDIPGASAGRRFAVWGQSQGGHAALWTGQLARSYAPDLTLVGVAAAAPPTNLVENLRSGDNPQIRAFLIAFTAYAWSQHFGAPLTTLGDASTVGVITRLAQNNCVRTGVTPSIGAIIGVVRVQRGLRNVDLTSLQPWARIARQNSPAARNYGVPFLIAQNPGDVIISPAVTRSFAQRLCRARARVRYINIVGDGHETSGTDTAAATLDWIDGRFAGTVAPTDCSTL